MTRPGSIALYIRVALPFFAGFLLLSWLSYVVYSGGKRVSIAAKAEALLIDFSLDLRPWPPSSPEQVAVVSFSDDDVAEIGRDPQSTLIDSSIATYARVVDRLLETEPGLVVVSWLAGGRTFSAEQLAPLQQVIRSRAGGSRVFVSLPFVVSGQPPTDVSGINFLDGDDCIYEINRICSNPTSWDEWIIRFLVKTYWPAISDNHISDNLPYTNSFLLNFPPERVIPRYTFRDILNGPNLPKGQIYFVGNNATQPEIYRDAKYMLQRTLAFDSVLEGSLQENGKPLHFFWAQLAAMLRGQNSVWVAPKWLTDSLLLLLSLVLVYALTRAGLSAVLLMYLVICVGLPISNAAAISIFGVYFPAFEILFGGLIVCTGATFVMASISYYQRIHSAALSTRYQDVADLKTNFMSLVSHNLNTSMAKFTGLSDILVRQQGFASQASLLQEIDQLIGRLFLCVRCVLISTTLSEGRLAPAVIRLRELAKTFKTEQGIITRRLGVDFEVELPEDQEMEQVLVDKRVIGLAMACLVGLARNFSSEACLLQLTAQDNESLEVTASFYLCEEAQRHTERINKAGHEPPESGRSKEFLMGLLLDFLHSTVQLCDGRMEANHKDQTLVCRLRWQFNPGISQGVKSPAVPQPAAD